MTTCKLCDCDNRLTPGEATTLGRAIATVAHLPCRVDMQGPLHPRVRAAADWALARHNKAWEAWHAKCACPCHDQGE